MDEYFRPPRSLEEQIDGLSLFDQGEEPAPSKGGSSPRMHHGVDTSQAEEERLRRHGGTKKAIVLAYIDAHSPCTRREIEDATGIRAPTICAIVDELKKKGDVLDCDGKRGRPLKSRNGGHLLYRTPNAGKAGEAA